MRLLITRPREDADRLAMQLRSLSHVPVIAPLMETRVLEGAPLGLDAVQALLATSANGIRAAASRTPRRDVCVYAVGPQTAEAAREAGFTAVESAEGDAAALVEYVAGHADPKKGMLVHAAGTETVGRLRQALQARGFSVETAVLYEAVPATILPPVAAEHLKGDTLDGVLLYSPRSAKIFTTLVTAAKLAAHCPRLTAYCISAATAAELSDLSFARIAVAGAPNQDEMLALLG